MTAAGEWLPRQRYAQCDATCTTDCGPCKGQGPPAPLVPGVIARQLVDASEAYARSLADLWREALDPAPADD